MARMRLWYFIRANEKGEWYAAPKEVPEVDGRQTLIVEERPQIEGKVKGIR